MKNRNLMKVKISGRIKLAIEKKSISIEKSMKRNDDNIRRNDLECCLFFHLFLFFHIKSLSHQIFYFIKTTNLPF